MEDYLKAIHQLAEGRDDRVRTSEIADALGVTPPTVTSMLDKLEERELVDREKYEGVTLTTDGERIAIEVIRHHRLLEAYLTEQLDYSWDEVHEEADRLEHHISDDFVTRVEATLDNPETDPHGDPIPTPALELPEPSGGAALPEFGEGESIVVEQVNDRDPDVLEYLADHGIEPGTELRIAEVAPFGMVTVRVAGSDRRVSLPEHVAQHVRVAPGEPA